MNLNKVDYYINRELSWLQFNTRVLQETHNESLPILERLKFLAIYGTNLDEFYMIRVAGLEELFASSVNISGPDGLTPLEQLKEIRTYIHHEQLQIEKIYVKLFKTLKKDGLILTNYNELEDSLKSKVSEYFFSNIFPVIIPIAVDATHPFPRLNNLSFGIILKLHEEDNEAAIKYSIIRIPRILQRFIEIENGIFVPVESIVKEFAQEIFPAHTLITSTTFRVTRNADMAVEEEEADDFLEVMEEGLRSRQRGKLVRLELEKNSDSDLSDFFNSHTNILSEDIYEYETPLNLGALWQIVSNKDFAHLALKSIKPKVLPPLDANDNIFKVIDKKDIMLNHPYQSFDPVVKFIKDASIDKDVVSIKMTLYRVGSNSPIVKALIEAAISGKQVTVMVELKARFDEENNLVWAKRLERSGAHVVYGIKGLKVHAKIALVVKNVNNELKHYVHLSTGNYNPQTARIYTDVSLFTCRKEFGIDATRFFHQITGFSKNSKLSTLYVAPLQIKPKILSLIEAEEKMLAEGRIIVKINSLVDQDIIKALYKASIAGVKISLIIRGICTLRPGIKDISDNIKVISIIGKNLEHSRIFYFKHSTPKIFISSADWMPRNLDRRVELMTPILDEKTSNELYELLQLQLNDNVLSYELDSNGKYTKSQNKNDKPINSQLLLEEYAQKLYSSKNKKKKISKIEKLTKRFLKES